jgi:hypothetical protein
MLFLVEAPPLSAALSVVREASVAPADRSASEGSLRLGATSRLMSSTTLDRDLVLANGGQFATFHLASIANSRCFNGPKMPIRDISFGEESQLATP